MKKIISVMMCALLATTPVCASDTESDSGFFGIFGDALDFVSSTATEAGKATQDAMNAAGEALEQFGTDVSEQTEIAVNGIGDFFVDLGENITVVAGQVSEAAASVSQDVIDQSVIIADQALTGLNGAANVVIDSTGNIINMAAEGADVVSSAAQQAFDTIASQGEDLAALANDAVVGLDLTDPESVEKAREAIDKAFDDANEAGFFEGKLSYDTIQIIKDVLFGTTVYGYQYANGIITLPEYSALMSKIIIKAGLPTGVGYLAGLLPIPGASFIAKEVTAFLIQVAYGEGEEEALYEDTTSLAEGKE